VDLSTELQILAFHEQRKTLAADREARAAVDGRPTSDGRPIGGQRARQAVAT
jgi:hypothetical protein